MMIMAKGKNIFVLFDIQSTIEKRAKGKRRVLSYPISTQQTQKPSDDSYDDDDDEDWS